MYEEVNSQHQPSIPYAYGGKVVVFRKRVCKTLRDSFSSTSIFEGSQILNDSLFDKVFMVIETCILCRYSYKTK
jgi:hypothetical protein